MAGWSLSDKPTAQRPDTPPSTRTRTARTARRSSSHPASELVLVEIVSPRVDLAVTDLEGPHDLQLERLAREPEDVHPLGHHDRTIGCDVDDAEVDTLDAWRARPDERGDRLGDGLPASDRRQRDVMVNGVVGEKCGQFADPDIVGPRRAEPAHYLNRALHLASPAVDLVGTSPGPINASATADAILAPLVAALTSTAGAIDRVPIQRVGGMSRRTRWVSCSRCDRRSVPR